MSTAYSFHLNALDPPVPPEQLALGGGEGKGGLDLEGKPFQHFRTKTPHQQER